MKNKRSFLKSFIYALKGIIFCIKNERNMRFHTVFCLYIIYFSFYFNLNYTDYALLFLAMSGVFVTEMLNTAIEKLCDFVCNKHNKLIGMIKDIAAGAVFVSALFAVCIGAFVLYRPQEIVYIFNLFTQNLAYLCGFIFSLILSVLYIIYGISFKRKIK